MATGRGQLFHLLVQQSALGIDVDATVAANGDPVLSSWWENYLRFAPRPGDGERVLSEVELSAAVGEFSAVAKFDRIVLPAPGSGASTRIIDWKTGQLRPRQADLQRSWQTAVYCYVFTEGGGTLIEGEDSGAIDPGRLELQYWHAGFPDALEPIRYSAAMHAEAGDRLQRGDRRDRVPSRERGSGRVSAHRGQAGVPSLRVPIVLWARPQPRRVRGVGIVASQRRGEGRRGGGTLDRGTRRGDRRGSAQVSTRDP